MVGSRHLQGTILTRVKQLVTAGSIKTLPLWYNIVNRFPPPSTSLLSLDTDSQDTIKSIKKIEYLSDEVKREFYTKNTYAFRDPINLLNDDVGVTRTKVEIFLEEYYKCVDTGDNHNEAMKNAQLSYNRLLEEKNFEFKRNQKYEYFRSGDTPQKYEDGKSVFNMDEILDLFTRKK